MGVYLFYTHRSIRILTGWGVLLSLIALNYSFWDSISTSTRKTPAPSSLFSRGPLSLGMATWAKSLVIWEISWATQTKMNVLTIMFKVGFPGMRTRMPLVSAASQIWYWHMKSWWENKKNVRMVPIIYFLKVPLLCHFTGSSFYFASLQQEVYNRLTGSRLDNLGCVKCRGQQTAAYFVLNSSPWCCRWWRRPPRVSGTVGVCGSVCSGNGVSSSQDPPLQNMENMCTSAALCLIQI